MPPKRNVNKQKQIQNKRITTRLMAIRLTVEKYIYKNKHITISEAEMYLEELASLLSFCFGDAPSLQVCEKLTRLMRGIIEEQQSNDARVEDTETFIELNHPSTYAASPVYSLPDDDKTHIASQLITELQSESNESNYDPSNDNNNTDEGNEENDLGPRKSVRFHIDDDKTNYNDVIAQTVDKALNINTYFNDERCLSSNRHCNVDNELTNEIVDLTLNDTEQPINIDGDLCSQSLLKEMKDTPNILDENLITDTCGQDMVEFDREIKNLIQTEARGSKYNTRTVSQKNTPTKQNTSATIEKNPYLINTSKISEKRIEVFNSTETNKTIKNNPTKNTKYKKKETTKRKNKDKPQMKRRTNKTDTKITENSDDTRVFTPLTNKSDIKYQAATNTINESNNGFIVGQITVNSTEIGNDSIVSIPGTKNSLDTTHLARPNISIILGSKVVCHEEDLSWVENLTYVREIHLEEYDSSLKPQSETFWDNCELPDNWDGRDFEWT